MKIRYSNIALAVSLAFSTCYVMADAQSDENTAAIAALKTELVKQKDESVQFNGYMRAGFTTNENGSASGNTTIKAPNAGGFFRLGGGESNYAAWNLNKKFTADSNAWAKAYIGLVYEDRDARRWVFDSANKTMFMDKAYVEMGGLDFAPDATFWAGRVNFGWDIHILDRKYYEIRSPGIGMKGMPMGDGTFDLFVVSNDSDSNTEYTAEDGTTVEYADGARPRTHTLGAEYKTGPWWIAASAQTNSNDEEFQVTNNFGETYVNKPATTGAHLMVNYTQPGFFGLANGRTKYIAQYAMGTSAAFLGRAGDTSQSNDGGQNYRLFIDALATAGKWDTNVVLGAQQKRDVNYDGHENTWLVIGARPMYHVTENFAMQFEAGYNWSKEVSNDAEESGGLATFTIAPTLKLKSAYFSRPEIRAYVNYAKYTGDYTASALDGYTTDDQDTLTFGAQAEVWF